MSRAAVLVGNGFDLHCGFDTSTTNFIQSFIDHYRSYDGIPQDPNEAPGWQLAKTISQDIESWGDFELAMGSYASQFDSSMQDGMVNYADQCLSLSRYLREWLQAQTQGADDSFIEKHFSPMMHSLTGWWTHNLCPRDRGLLFQINGEAPEDLIYDIVCFNYTDILERLFKRANERRLLPNYGLREEQLPLGNFVYAHESLGASRLACGVDNAEQISNEQFRSDTMLQSLLVKERIQADGIASANDRIATGIIKKADVALVYGMSFGQTDRRWWRKLVDRLTECGWFTLVIFWYENGFDNDEYRKLDKGSLQSVRARVIDHFIDAAEMGDLPPYVRDRIMVLPSSMLFPLDEAGLFA